MAVRAGLESGLIEAVCRHARERLPAAEAALHAAFVRRYYEWVPSEDLAGRSVADLYGAAAAHLRLARRRRGGEAKVRVYNPDGRADGWSSPHTVIEVVSDDMPFIVDSVTMELARRGHGIDLVIHPVIRLRRDRDGRLLEVLAGGHAGAGAMGHAGAGAIGHAGAGAIGPGGATATSGPGSGATGPEGATAGETTESVLHAEVVREPDEGRLAQLAGHIERVLGEVGAAVADWAAMRGHAIELAAELERGRSPVGREELVEAAAFLRWVADEHFVFLGYREYELVPEGRAASVRAVPETGLGILRGPPATPSHRLGRKALALALAPHALILTKANSRATVHRPARLDYIGVKRFDAAGGVRRECRFLGLYTTSAYRASPREVPLLRGRVEAVLARAGFPAASHDAKALLEILESYPRDTLLQMGADDAFAVATGLLGLGERQRVRLFVWPDPLERFVTCLVTIPRDRFNTQSRERVGGILLDAFDGTELDWTLQLSESLLARVHYIVRCRGGVPEGYDVAEIERRLAAATRAWSDELREALIGACGEEEGVRLHRRYERAFPPAYQSDWSARDAVEDIRRVERLLAGCGTIISLYRPSADHPGPSADRPAASADRPAASADRPAASADRPAASADRPAPSEGSGGTPAEDPGSAAARAGAPIRCRLYSADDIALSDVLPTFEHMGTRVVDERPYRIAPTGQAPAAWIYDFGLRGAAEDVERVRETFERVFLAARRGELDDDPLNGLVLACGLDGGEIGVLRAIARYLRQLGIPYSDAYMERTLLAHAAIARLLVRMFAARFDPDRPDPPLAERLGREIEAAIDGVESLDEDRILRGFLAVLRAMLRTSYFRRDGAGAPLPYLSFKLDPAQVPLVPRPRPQFEIFVYSPRFQAVHLRGGRVARGGIRWSDRREDFRTEILGLMKAQMVKNSLIVPVGAKGGFVLSGPRAGGGRRPAPGDPEALRGEAIACYRMFLSGLLDLTDNIVGGKVLAPDRVVRYDGDDPYLVVAADKGTATFSDIANEISAAYGFWLGDAFASGGSHGYDHKRMGITARGVWESARRHFRELGVDVQRSEFTAVGIGDMSGDVFGNGMLRSPHVRLLAAFNHAHVFLDPDPDPAASFAERKRLFELERSAWSDYDPAVISRGGGVYPRSAKSIPISPEARRALAIEARELTPAELIRAMLRAPVDLLFNGGVGTYVKASGETHADAGDKANDPLRVDGRELRCLVVAEGGNLGFTQRGRIEYALLGGPDGRGGRINTDSIDNVAGVNCSDHEVNIKILLDSLVARGRLSERERNRLLVEMTDAVAEQVLYASRTQTQAISLALAQAAPMIDVHARLIRRLEQVAGLDRALELLPDEDAISERKAAHRGLVAPELAIVMAHTKIHLYRRLLESDLPEDAHMVADLERYFPAPLPERFGPSMRTHRLRREIIATTVANQLVDRAGTTFAFRLGEETNASPSLLARAYAVAREVFEMRSFWGAVERLDDRVAAGTQLGMLIEGRRLLERASRWLVSAHPESIDVGRTVRRFQPGASVLLEALPGVLDGADVQAFERREAELAGAGVPPALASRVAAMPSLPALFDLVAIAGDRPLEPVARTYFHLGSRLGLDWLRDRIIELPRANRWQALARTALRQELLGVQRELAREVIQAGGKPIDGDAAIERWSQRNAAGIERALSTIAEIRASRIYDTTTLPVALREVRALIHHAVEGAGPGAG